MEEEVLALKVVNESLKLPSVKVNRNAFLTKMFQDKVDNVQELFDDGPEKVLSKKELDRAAQKCINQAVMQSSAISFATGIPGGLAMGSYHSRRYCAILWLFFEISARNFLYLWLP